MERKTIFIENAALLDLPRTAGLLPTISNTAIYNLIKERAKKAGYPENEYRMSEIRKEENGLGFRVTLEPWAYPRS